MAFSVKRFLVGQPLATDRADHERLPKILALPVFSSDAISSVAYATEATMVALMVAGTGSFWLTPWLTLGIVVLLAIVTTSYRQTVMAYPSGGGSYIVARDNLGELPAQAAGASLLVDYVLTVAVSVASGIAAIVSLVKAYWPTSHIDRTEYVVLMCVGCVLFIALMNLRGIRESGALFAIPTYSFIAIMYVLLGVGLYKLLVLHGIQPAHSQAEFTQARDYSETTHSAIQALRPLSAFLILHAFASGCTALTGVEAISNGVPAFRDPTSRNAATTMMWMATILGSMFLGLSYLAVHINALPPTAVLAGTSTQIGDTVLSQVGIAVLGKGFLFIVLQIATCAILVVAANTSFADFPRLSAIMARDGFLPRQFANIGDKLVYDRGIVVLSILAIILIAVFRGSVDALIPLYAIGVFLSFTLSQAGMVSRWFKRKSPGWQGKAVINGSGAVLTLLVTLIFGVVKFMYGAWVVVVLIPALIAIFFRIHAHYRSVAKQLSLEGYRPQQGTRHHVLVLAPDIHRGVIPALQYARTISEDVKALHVSIDPTREKRVRERWPLWSRGMPLTVLASPYRSLLGPIVEYINKLHAMEPRSLVTVVIPVFVPSGWWPKLLHGQAALMLSLRLGLKSGVVVINVPYHIEAYVPLPRAEIDLSQHDMGTHDQDQHDEPGSAKGQAEAVLTK